ncbi:DUF4145 domain-containing protein [Pseudomonas sp. B21-010]|uniref:DUF4145 domain-containing protein n=1 Tax=Pseudomonas sp. B21-010 TaxID=2895471 RepID=UPI00215FEE4C|nr:DUF4145 domain-containing protein [Pseudomonas sp. B21-010]UVM63295.1 DUF4145 domain-containing protein [Pseudomonas sp. B21-010]
MTKTFKAHCPRCDGERTCFIHGEFERRWDSVDEQHPMWGQSDYKLAQCRGCEEVFFHQSSWDSENWDFEYDPKTGQDIAVNPCTITTFPTPEKKSKKPDWVWDIAKIDPQLFTILNEMYQAYEQDSFILASVGLRTAFDRSTEVLKVDPALSLEAKVKHLLEVGFIGETESETLAVVTDAGSAAAHRAWSPNQDEFQTLLITLEQFIYRTVISGKAALAVAKNIPARPPRAPKTPKAKP